MKIRGLGCRSCGHGELREVLSLGRTPLANAYLTAAQLAEAEATYPLQLAVCMRCSLVQITETVLPDTLFRDYLYFSSFSETMLKHVERLVQRLVSERNLGSDSLVLEIGSNDGYLLQYYKRRGIRVLGIEPARNVAQVARQQRAIPTVSEFFGETMADKISREHGPADVIHIHNVLAHVADLAGFVRGVRQLLKKEGVVVVEVPYVRDMVERCEFDTIYHEHLCYFSLTALMSLFAQVQLQVLQVERIGIHGGSLRVFVGNGEPDRAVMALLEEELDWGVDRVEPYLAFASRVHAVRTSLRELLLRLKGEEKRLAGYGAAAKGTVLLNFCGIGRELLEFVADRSPHKQGRYMPGVHIPIVSTARLVEARPDYVLLLAWNLADEIVSQQKEYLLRGGRFILPIPEPVILE